MDHVCGIKIDELLLMLYKKTIDWNYSRYSRDISESMEGMFLLFLFIYRLILFAIESDFYIRIQTGFERDAILGDAAPITGCSVHRNIEFINFDFRIRNAINVNSAMIYAD